MIHELKTWPEFFEPIIDGRKNFEIRRNDRNFQVGDYLKLRECDQNGDYTGRDVMAQVEYITDYKQQTGFVVMAITVFRE